MELLTKNIKRICKAKGISRKDLAERLGVSLVSVSRLMTSNIRLSSLERLAEALECEVSDFFVNEHRESTHPTYGERENSIWTERAFHDTESEEDASGKIPVYGFIRIGDQILEIQDMDDFRDAFLKCEVNYL